jgi:lysophospholipase L1-like esterase
LLHREEKIRGTSLEEEEGRYYLEGIKDISKKNNLPIFAVIFPYLKPVSEYENYERQQYQTICKAVKDLKIPYLNLYEHLPEKNLYSLREEKEDEIHPSRKGHHLIAEVIYDYMLDNFFKVN